LFRFSFSFGGAKEPGIITRPGVSDFGPAQDARPGMTSRKARYLILLPNPGSARPGLPRPGKFGALKSVSPGKFGSTVASRRKVLGQRRACAGPAQQALFCERIIVGRKACRRQSQSPARCRPWRACPSHGLQHVAMFRGILTLVDFLDLRPQAAAMRFLRGPEDTGSCVLRSSNRSPAPGVQNPVVESGMAICSSFVAMPGIMPISPLRPPILPSASIARACREVDDP